MASSRDEFEKSVTRLIDGFLSDLSKTVAKHRPHDYYNFQEMKQEMKGIMPTLAGLSQRWSLEILFLLYMRNLRFNEFKNLLMDISSRTLTDKLRMLQKNGFVARKIIGESPVQIQYSLTANGKAIALSCLPLLYQLQRSILTRNRT